MRLNNEQMRAHMSSQVLPCYIGIWHDCPEAATTTVTIKDLRGLPLELAACQACVDDLKPRAVVPKGKRPTVVRFRPAWQE